MLDNNPLIQRNKDALFSAFFTTCLFALFWFCWASYSRAIFNGLATPLFFALTAYLLILCSRYTISVNPRSLLLYSAFTVWVLFVDLRSGEFFPALASDAHWLILPVAVLLLAQVFREFPAAFLAIQIGSALCMVNLLATLLVNAEWYDNWHYPPIFGHIQHLALSIGFMTVILFVRQETSKGVAIFLRIARIIGLATSFWTGSRSFLLAWLCCLAVFVLNDRKRLGELLVDTVAGYCLSLFPTPPFPKPEGKLPRILGGVQLKSLSEVTVNTITSFRLEIWKSALSNLDSINHLWTGVGGNGYARLQTLHKVSLYMPGHVQPHNGVVQAICSWGIIGTTLFASFAYHSFFKPVFAVIRKCDSAALAGIVYLLVTGMLDATLYHLEHLIYLMISMAYLLSGHSLPEESAKKLAIPAPIIAAGIALLAVVHMQSLSYRIGLFWYFPTQ